LATTEEFEKITKPFYDDFFLKDPGVTKALQGHIANTLQDLNNAKKDIGNFAKLKDQ
jgi:hypothetical protein